MTKFENINSPSERPSLEKQIQFAVAQAVEPLFCTGSWRTYTGPHQDQLVSELGPIVGSGHVGLACSGSAALEIVLRACRLGPGDEVLLSAYDYPGNFTAIENCGGRPALVDVAPHGWNLSFESLADTYTPACKALIVSHLHGQLQDMPALQAWCRERKVLLIQDACQALGATLAGQRLGAWGDATILSFGGSKIISAGRGGAWCTNDHALAQHARLAAGVGSGAYEMSELQAAMVLAQLPFLDRITESCRAYFGRLRQSLAFIQGLEAPWLDQLSTTAFYQAGWLLPSTQIDKESTIVTDTIVKEIFKDSGTGFSGFHRRSERRCRKPSSLQNTADVVARTATLHHRLALVTD